MNMCAIQYSPNCKETTLDGKRGICTECYNQLLDEELIQEGMPFPEWLAEMVKIQDTYDNSSEEEKEPNFSDLDFDIEEIEA